MLCNKCPDFYQTTGEPIADPQALLDTLGGTMRIAEVFSTVAFPKAAETVAEELISSLPEGKITFGLSHFPEDNRDAKTLLIGIKKAIRKRERPVRFANRDFRNLDAGTLHKEQLFLPKSCEILAILDDNKKLVLAKTIAAQNVDAFAERDYGKSVRDMQVGMLPPKLALMLINFAAKEKELPQQIWDSFCGTGTIAVEALRMGLVCTSSDISAEMVQATSQNLAHFFPQQKPQVFQHDVTKKLTHGVLAQAIVTEGYLGPIYKRPVSEHDLEVARKDVEPIYEAFFTQALKLPAIETIVICMPFWKTTANSLAFCENALAAAQKFWKNTLACDGISSRGSLLFRRSDQSVGREIFVFRRQ